jgi:hypothetical protein
MLLSGTLLPLSTPPLSLLLFFSPRSFLPYTFFALTLERYSFVPTIVCLLGVISLRNSWAIGATIPYTSVFNEAARLRDVGKGVAQGLVSVISVPTVILGPPIIGFLFENTGNFTLAFGSILIFSTVAVTSSFLAGPAVKRETNTSPQPSKLLTKR